MSCRFFFNIQAVAFLFVVVLRRFISQVAAMSLAEQEKQVWVGNIPLEMDEPQVIEYVSQLLSLHIEPPFKAFVRNGKGTSSLRFAILSFRRPVDASWFVANAIFKWPNGKYALIDRSRNCLIHCVS